MTIFTYTAINENGNEISGEIDAGSQELALQLIASRGLIPETVKKKTPSPMAGHKPLNQFLISLTPVKPKDIILFTKQLKTLIQAGISIIQILSILELQTENKRLKAIIAQISEEIKEGASLSAAFLKHKKYSPRCTAACSRPVNPVVPCPMSLNGSFISLNTSER